MSTDLRDRTDGWTVRIDGREPLVLSPAELIGTPEWTLVRKSLRYECASGDWIEDEWTGVPVFELLEAAEMPDTTTHIQVESADGDLACVELLALGDGIVAVGGSEAGDQQPTGGDEFPRLLAPRLLGPRTMKRLTHVRPLTLEPNEDREQYEKLPV
jgi:DMSO/TMAO reductase YedYZ molybdopterin-dependent catalytic subunit